MREFNERRWRVMQWMISTLTPRQCVTIQTVWLAIVFQLDIIVSNSNLRRREELIASASRQCWPRWEINVNFMFRIILCNHHRHQRHNCIDKVFNLWFISNTVLLSPLLVRIPFDPLLNNHKQSRRLLWNFAIPSIAAIYWWSKNWNCVLLPVHYPLTDKCSEPLIAALRTVQWFRKCTLLFSYLIKGRYRLLNGNEIILMELMDLFSFFSFRKMKAFQSRLESFTQVSAVGRCLGEEGETGEE